MKAKIEIKGALCGAAIGVLAMFAIGAEDSSNPVGRYQVAGGAGFFTIVDAATGQAWSANLAAPPPGLQGEQTGYWEKKVDK